MMADVKAEHRLGERNPTFRGNLLVAEGTQSDTAILSQSDGILLQELPFAVELKTFVVEYYSTGMPKLFASDIVIHDKETGEKIATRVEVNHPASHKGIEIYQSSFDDGGSTVKFKAIPMHAPAKAFDLEGTIGGSSKLSRGKTDGSEQLTVEYTGLRVINVENFAGDRMSGTDVRKVDLRASLDASLGAANKPNGSKDLRNVGPSVSYKLRDASGQAKEFNNYMLPVTMAEGSPVFLLGMRETPSEPFRYLRIPVDANGGMDDFMRLRYALLTPRSGRRRSSAMPLEQWTLKMRSWCGSSLLRRRVLCRCLPGRDRRHLQTL
jgi:cytochrome c biogenesis protein